MNVRKLEFYFSRQFSSIRIQVMIFQLQNALSIERNSSLSYN